MYIISRRVWCAHSTGSLHTITPCDIRSVHSDCSPGRHHFLDTHTHSHLHFMACKMPRYFSLIVRQCRNYSDCSKFLMDIPMFFIYERCRCCSSFHIYEEYILLMCEDVGRCVSVCELRVYLLSRWMLLRPCILSEGYSSEWKCCARQTDTKCNTVMLYHIICICICFVCAKWLCCVIYVAIV